MVGIDELRKRKKLETIIKTTLVLLLLGGLVAGVLGFSSIRTWAAKHYIKLIWERIKPEPDDDPYTKISEWIDLSQPYNVLLVGIDRGSVEDDDATRSDVIILASVDVEEKKAVLVSFPRDTRVDIPGHGTQKINAARAYSGMEGTIEVVKDISGMEINDYAEVDFAAFEKIVDAIGGVTLHLDYPILDPKIGALPAGDVFLNGEDALVLVRSRDLPRGDLDRIDNQKKFLKAVMKKAVEVRDLQALLAILDAAVKYMDTTIEPDMLFTLAEALGGMQVEAVEFATLPGEDIEPATPDEPWYFVMEEGAAAELFRNVKLYTSALSPEQQEAENARREQEETAEVDRSGMNLAVLNGAGWQGLAAGVAEIMEARGYTDVSMGNTVNPYELTTIYYASGCETEARMVARDLDAEAEFVLSEDADVTSRHDAEVVLVLGEDYTGT